MIVKNVIDKEVLCNIGILEDGPTVRLSSHYSDLGTLQAFHDILLPLPAYGDEIFCVQCSDAGKAASCLSSGEFVRGFLEMRSG